MQLRLLAVLGYAAVLVAQAPDYGGPSVLSRGMVPSIQTRHANIDFIPRVGISATCDNGLTGVSVDAQGRLPNVFSCGFDGSAGLSGYHTWRRTRLGVDYSGHYRHYLRAAFYNGSDQLLALGLTHQLSKRVLLTFRESAGTYSRNYFGAGGAGVYDPDSLQRGAPNLFDSPVVYGSTAADLTYILSARWSVNAGGAAFANRYRSAALYGATSYGAHGDMAYRYSRYGTIGGVYQFMHGDFTRSFGSFDYHVMALAYAVRPARTVEFQLQVGAGRVESLTAETVAVDPVIAAITGQTSGVVAAYHLNYVPDIAAGLTKTFRNSSLAFRYTHSISVGNGLYLSSIGDTAGASFTYSGVRHWSFNAGVGYNKLRAIQQSLATYNAYTAGVGVVRTLRGGLQFTLEAEERHFDTGYAHFRRDALRVSAGFVWSPGDIPVSIW